MIHHPLFAQNQPTVIGMIHFSPLEGHADCPGKDVVLDRARKDLDTLLAGGVNAILFENNFDFPKRETLLPETAAHFEELVQNLTPISVPWGIVALWNDYRLGFRLCAQYGGIMVRVPTFADSSETAYGLFAANPDAVLKARRDANAERVLILADVQVKHAKPVPPRPFAESLEDTIQRGADAVIVTGAWTGDEPNLDQCRVAHKISAGRVPVLTGSGMTAENVSDYAPCVDGFIVGTAFKAGAVNRGKRTGPNIVPAERRYDLARVRAFMDAVMACPPRPPRTTTK